MPANRQHIVDIVKTQAEMIEDLCPGYSDKILGLVDEILHLEDKHRVSTFDIQKSIDNKVDETADFLSQHKEDQQG